MSIVFRQEFRAGWGSMDFNGHMRNTAYLDLSADTRMLYFDAQGFSMREFERRLIGPVVRRDEIEYFREVRMLDSVTVELRLAGLSDDGSHFSLENRFLRADRQVAAVVHSSGGWLDLKQRRLIAPPKTLFSLIAELENTDDFKKLPSSLR